MRSPSTSTVGDYGRLLGRNSLLIVVSVLAATAAGWFAHTLQAPHYESESRLMIMVPGPATVYAAYAGDLGGRLRSDSYRDLATSDLVLGRVIAADRTHTIGSPLTVGDLRSRLVASVVPQSAVVEVTATGDTAVSAAGLAASVAVQMKQVVEEVEWTTEGTPQFDLDIVDVASAPTKVPKTSSTTSLALGGGIGFGIALAAVLGSELIRNRVHDGADLLHTLRDVPAEVPR